MAGAIFGDVGGCFLVLRALFIDGSNVSRINHESHFSWQAQYLVMLEGESWCSAQCE